MLYAHSYQSRGEESEYSIDVKFKYDPKEKHYVEAAKYSQEDQHYVTEHEHPSEGYSMTKTKRV